MRSIAATRSIGFDIVSISTQPGFARDGAVHGVQVADVDEVNLHAERLQHLGQQTPSRRTARLPPAIDFAPVDQRGDERHLNREHSGGAGQRARAALQRRDQFFERGAGRIVVARIAIAGSSRPVPDPVAPWSRKNKLDAA